MPENADGVVLVLHGGAERSRVRVHWWRLAVVRMVPFATAVRSHGGGRLAVVRLKYRVRGWNAPAEDPVADARWAMDRVRRVVPDAPVALVGHSMGGRVALRLAGAPGVVAVAALAPWLENDAVQPRPGTQVLLMHGDRDRITDPRRTEVVAERLDQLGAVVRHVPVEGETHAMLRHPRRWHETVAEFVVDALPPPRRAD